MAAESPESNHRASSFMAQIAEIAAETGRSGRMRGQYETITAGEVSPIAVAGAVIRYAFYAVGALVLGAIGLGIMAVGNWVPKAVDAPPAFRINSGEFASKPTSGHVVTLSLIHI